MLFQPQPVTPLIIKVVPPPMQEVSVVDVLVDALTLTGLLAVGAMLVGIVFGILLIVFKRWRDRDTPGGETIGTRLDLSSR